MRQGRNPQLSLVVVGESGQGKSSLINGLLGEEIAKESDDLESATESVQSYTYTQNGVHVTLWDTPGFGMLEEEEEAETLRKIVEGCGTVDLLLYCIRMDSTRWPKRSDVTTVRQYAEAFGRAIWRHSLFVLTFANAATRLCPRGQDVNQYFTEQVRQWENQIQRTLIRYAGLEEEEAWLVDVVPVGDPRPDTSKKILWTLPHQDDWFTSFWLHCTKRMRQRSLQSLLQLNKHRCETNESVAVQESQNEEERETLPSAENCNHHQDVIEDRTGMDAREEGETPYSRPVPMFEIIRSQLQQSESGLQQYVTAFAAERGRSVYGIGHVGGFIEGMVEWATAKKNS